jgi:hypothetical protein
MKLLCACVATKIVWVNQPLGDSKTTQSCKK